MFSFNTFKDKRYWILLLPTIIILILLAIFTSNIYIFGYINVCFVLVLVALFWMTYHLWRYFGDKKKVNNLNDVHDK